MLFFGTILFIFSILFAIHNGFNKSVLPLNFVNSAQKHITINKILPQLIVTTNILAALKWLASVGEET
jgi:hypothetical protein